MDFFSNFSKCEHIHRKLRICSHLLKKSITENFIFCAVTIVRLQLVKSSIVIRFYMII